VSYLLRGECDHVAMVVFFAVGLITLAAGLGVPLWLMDCSRYEVRYEEVHARILKREWPDKRLA